MRITTKLILLYNHFSTTFSLHQGNRNNSHGSIFFTLLSNCPASPLTQFPISLPTSFLINHFTHTNVHNENHSIKLNSRKHYGQARKCGEDPQQYQKVWNLGLHHDHPSGLHFMDRLYSHYMDLFIRESPSSQSKIIKKYNALTAAWTVCLLQ